MSLVSERLPRGARLRSSRDFARVNRTGQRRACPHFVAVVAPARTETPAKLGLAVSRRVGNAVARNRVKRRVREWFRARRTRLPHATDWVLIARAGAAELDTVATIRELDHLVER